MMPIFEELVPKQRGMDAKLARGIEEDHDWHWVEGPDGPEPSTSIKDGWTIVAFALPEEFPNVEAVEHFVEADSPQAAMDKLVSYLQDLGFRGKVTVSNYSDTDVYFTAEVDSDEITVTPYNTNYEEADSIIGA
jgi:hypothetical protein